MAIEALRVFYSHVDERFFSLRNPEYIEDMPIAHYPIDSRATLIVSTCPRSWPCHARSSSSEVIMGVYSDFMRVALLHGPCGDDLLDDRCGLSREFRGAGWCKFCLTRRKIVKWSVRALAEINKEQTPNEYLTLLLHGLDAQIEHIFRYY